MSDLGSGWPSGVMGCSWEGNICVCRGFGTYVRDEGEVVSTYKIGQCS